MLSRTDRSAIADWCRFVPQNAGHFAKDTKQNKESTTN